jgi:hypothetical protein
MSADLHGGQALFMIFGPSRVVGKALSIFNQQDRIIIQT